MKINYNLVLVVYAPVLLLLLISIIRNRFEHSNKILRSCNWSLLSAIAIVFIFLSGEVIEAFWYLASTSILKKYPYNPINFEVFSFFFYAVLFLMVYLFLKYIYKVQFAQTFNIKISRIPFLIKSFVVLTLINVLSIYLLDLNLFVGSTESLKEYLKSLDAGHEVLYVFNTIILAPIVEESIFRGLLYNPLYRKIGRNLAIILTSLIWTFSHFTALLPSIIMFIIGLFLTWSYDKNGSLIHPIAFHIFINSWILFYL